MLTLSMHQHFHERLIVHIVCKLNAARQICQWNIKLISNYGFDSCQWSTCGATFTHPLLMAVKHGPTHFVGNVNLHNRHIVDFLQVLLYIMLCHLWRHHKLNRVGRNRVSRLQQLHPEIGKEYPQLRITTLVQWIQACWHDCLETEENKPILYDCMFNKYTAQSLYILATIWTAHNWGNGYNLVKLSSPTSFLWASTVSVLQ